MWFQQIIRQETGCASYMIGADNGQCAVFDPLWDIQPYIDLAKQKKATIRYVIDSHSHADHVSGARRLVQNAGGELVLPELAEAIYPATRVKGGDKLEMGEVTLEMVHAPGHRPEQLCLLVTDHGRGDEPWCVLTADFILVGDIARPDLAQAGEEGAVQLFEEAIPNFQGLADYVEVYPGHVAGST